MLIATLTKIVTGVAAFGVLATTALLVIPHPQSHNGVWLDTPLDKTVVEAGDVQLVLHSDIDGITAIYVNVTRDGASTAFLRDEDLERVQRGAGAERLSVFDQVWSVYDAGVYTLAVQVSGSTQTVRSFTVTVLEQAPVFVDTATGSSEPTPTPTPTPTVEPEAGPSGPLVPGSVVRFQPGDDDWASSFYLNAYSPAEAEVALELRITDTINNIPGDWQNYPCTKVTYNYGEGEDARYNCVISNHYLQPQSDFQIDGTWMSFSVEYRMRVTSAGETVYGPGGIWETARRSAS